MANSIFFGPGSLYVTRTDIPNQTPVNVGYAQEFSYDFAGDTKEAYGQNQLPLMAARGTTKVTGKLKSAIVSGLAWNALFFGQSFTAGSTLMNLGELFTLAAISPQTISSITSVSTTATLTTAVAHGLAPGASVTITGTTPAAYSGTFVVLTVPTTTTFTYTTLTAPGGAATVMGTYTVSSTSYTVLNAATFGSDLGVVYALTSGPLTKVASAPAKGQYAVNATTGTYTLAAADVGAQLAFSYSNTNSTLGQTLVINNTPIGTNPTFQLDYATITNGQTYYARFYQGIGSKLSIAHKLTDYAMPETDFSLFCNAANQLGFISLPWVG